MEWFEIAELLVELVIIIVIMAFFFYMLKWVMDLSITCWNNIYKCPIKPPPIPFLGERCEVSILW